MATIDEAVALFPETTAEDWRVCDSAVAHRDAVLRGAVLLGGVFRRGMYLGGVFHGGVYHDGVFRGGAFHGGVFRGGEYHGGVFRRGEYHDGVFHGGMYHGGVFHGGEFYDSPLFIQGSRYSICCSGGGMITSGCITKPLAWWIENVERCAEDHGYTPEQQTEYRRHVEYIAEWMRVYAASFGDVEHSGDK
uniref:Uncharacterized protein n=1 Tax=viral metagenome TaxID=1070528 RepID=A0A6M3L6R1_9ZZZZ